MPSTPVIQQRRGLVVHGPVAVYLLIERSTSANVVGGARFGPAAAGLDAALGGFFQGFAELRLDGRWVRFKACAGDDCGLCFYDASNNRTRRYCALRCSNRNKARTFRRRHPGHRPVRW